MCQGRLIHLDLESVPELKVGKGDDFFQAIMQSMLSQPLFAGLEAEQSKKVKSRTPVYKTFKLGEREITLCATRVDESNPTCVGVGYSVKMPDDKMNEELGKRIAYGRATNPKSQLAVSEIGLDFQSKVVFEGVLTLWEHKITNTPSKYIKGIKDVKSS